MYKLSHIKPPEIPTSTLLEKAIQIIAGDDKELVDVLTPRHRYDIGYND